MNNLPHTHLGSAQHLIVPELIYPQDDSRQNFVLVLTYAMPETAQSSRRNKTILKHNPAESEAK